jgi:hypothetical protein
VLLSLVLLLLQELLLLLLLLLLLQRLQLLRECCIVCLQGQNVTDQPCYQVVALKSCLQLASSTFAGLLAC